VLARALILRPDSLRAVELLGGAAENRSVDLEFYFSIKALYAIIQSDGEFRLVFRESRVGES